MTEWVFVPTRFDSKYNQKNVRALIQKLKIRFIETTIKHKLNSLYFWDESRSKQLPSHLLILNERIMIIV